VASLTVWKFNTPEGAENALGMLKTLEREMVVEIRDGAIVTWPADKKKPKTRQMASTTTGGALGGAFWGMLFGLLFFVPLFGMAIGAAAGALAGKLTDVGIDDNFIKQVRDEITPGTSALFLLVGSANIEKVEEAFEPGEMGELIRSNLTAEQEAKLREAFAEED
jgi:uncharacterized membrane protein